MSEPAAGTPDPSASGTDEQVPAAPVDTPPVDTPPADALPAALPLLEPRDGVPPVVDTPAALAATVAALAAGTGAIAIDAERAGGFRYGQRAYLLQFRREGAGTHLVDPIAFDSLASLQAVIGEQDWVLHAASQDLPCLREVGLTPTTLFDTELAGRLLGHARVGLSPLLEEVLGLALAKEHSAADWSSRPLPEPWLRYAALDVEVLLELRAALEAELVETGKVQWAAEEFAHVVATPSPAPRVDPWRRTSGLHRVRHRRALAVVRALWEARDDVARRRDTAPGRVLPDTAIVGAALAMPTTAEALAALPGFTGRGARRHLDRWWPAIEAARELGDDQLPAMALPTEGPPPARAWPERDPAAAARLAAARAAVAAVADEHHVPTENLLAPDSVRRLCWTPPDDCHEESVAAVLTGLGARPWQVSLTAPALSGALLRLPEVPASGPPPG